MNFLRSFFLFSFISSLSLGASRDPAQGGTKIFGHLKELLVRVKAADSLTSPKTSYGTGFVVEKSGLLITNFHVISDYVMQPGDQWKIIVEMSDGTNLLGELVNFSVVNDLALVKIVRPFSSAIPLEKSPAEKGDRIFSLGLPHDINMSIIEGTYNGIIDQGPYQTIHLSTPLNAGMSGGPSVNGNGRLVGVNVARVLFANNISFIVPEESVRELMAQIENSQLKPLSKSDAQSKLYGQLEKIQDKLVDSLFHSKSQTVELWKGKSITVPNYLKCWSEGNEEPALPFVLKHRTCRLDHALFLTEGLDVGSFSLDVRILDSSQINRFSVAKLWGDPGGVLGSIGQKEDQKFFGELDARDLFTSYECKQGFLQAPFWGKLSTLRTGVCLRRYKKSSDLYDFTFSFSDYSGALKANVEVHHSAVSAANINKLLSFWVEKFK